MKHMRTAGWLALPTLPRKIVKIALTLLALYCAFLFFGFSFRSEGRGGDTERHEHASFAIGTPEPWFHWNRTLDETTGKNGGSTSMHSESGFNLFTRSFAAGIVCLLLGILSNRIQRFEKAAGDGSA